MGGRGGTRHFLERGFFPTRTMSRAERSELISSEESTIRGIAERVGAANAAKESTRYLYGDMANLQQVRAELSKLGWSRERQDVALRRLVRDRKAWLIPATSELSKAQREATLRLGSQRMFLIRFMERLQKNPRLRLS